jgi:hypothetical protein
MRLTGSPIGPRYGHIFNPYLCRATPSASSAPRASTSKRKRMSELQSYCCFES